MGIDQERFVEVNPELVCCICTNVLDDPIESPCRHVFCTECITRWLDMRPTCPTCRQPLRNYQMKPALPLLRNIIAKLRIRCDFIEEGCTEIIDYEQLGSHLRSCAYGPMTCENEGCQVTFPRKNKCQHEAECPFRRVVCSAFSNHGCGMEYKLSEAANHNCVESLKSMVRDLGGKVATLEQTVYELRQSIQEMKDAQLRNNHVQDTRSATNSTTTGRTGHQDGDSGLISLLSEDEEESDEHPWTPTRAHLLQNVIAESSTNSFANLLVRNLQEGVLGRQTDHDQLQLDRERRQSRALHRSSPGQRGRSRSRSPTGRRNRESSPIESGTRRRRSRMSASSTCTQTSSSDSNTQESSNSPVVRPRRRRTIRPISIEDDNSGQVDITGNSASSSDESDQQNATEASDGNETSPHWSLDHSPAYSSSDDSYLRFADTDDHDWWRNLINTYSSSASFSSDGSCITATFH